MIPGEPGRRRRVALLQREAPFALGRRPHDRRLIAAQIEDLTKMYVDNENR